MGFGSAPFGSSPFGSGESPETGLGIVDSAYNPLDTPAVSQMLGWVEPLAETEVLSQRIYEFLVEEIRREDQLRGNYFVKRYLQGPQNIWDQIWNRTFEVSTLADVVSISDDFLFYLQDMVGWVGKLKKITERLDAQTLRRLISVSARFWKLRGTEDTITGTIRLLIPVRVRIWNWFDYRWVLDETGFGHENSGHDPWMISVDGDREMNLRLVDDGTVDRTLVREMVKLMRPSGERIEIVYLAFLDLFETNDDNSQWAGDPLLVDTGLASLSDTSGAEEAYVSVDGATDWSTYMACWRVRGESYGVVFYRANVNNKYMFKVQSGVWTLSKLVSNVETVLSTGMAPYPYSLLDNEFYMVRVEAITSGGSNLINVYIDGVLMTSETDSSLTAGGSVGVMHLTGGAIDLDELEVLSLPVQSDYIDINS